MDDPVRNSTSTERAAPPAPDQAIQDRLLEQLRRATLGEYDIAGELGHGGMSTVYLAHDLALDRKVAIKVMAPGLAYGPGMVERFKREARTAAGLSHPNIIPIFAVKEAEGLLFFVMKLVEGTQLDSIIHELGKLPVPMVEAILAQVGGAFGYAHRRGVVHRDIKPSNILIDEEGWAIVTDFGIAKVNEREGLTVSGATVGTPTYMSPEQCTGGDITGASDQYSLGVVAYEMLTGQPPFSGPNMMSVLFSHFRDAPAPLGTLRPDCPPALREAVMRMLSKDPAERFPSMEAAITAIGATQLSPDDASRTQLILLARTGANNRAVSQIQTPRSAIPLHRKQSDPSKGTKRRFPLMIGAALVVVVGAGVYLGLLRPRGGSAPVEAAVEPAAPQPTAALPPSPPAAPSPAPVQPRQEARPAGEQKPNPGRQPPSSPAPLPAPLVIAPAPPPTVLPQPPVAAPAPAPALAPAPLPPPPTAPERNPVEAAAALAAARFSADSTAVVGAITGYARALDSGDLNAARRMFPGMPDDQREGLQAFWRSGGTMKTRWTIGDITVDGDLATARISGTNLVSSPRARDAGQPVSLRARLERQAGVWKLIRLDN